MSVPAFCWRWSSFSWLFWIILKRPWPLYCLYSVWVCIWLTPGILNSYTFSLFYFSPSHLSHHHWSLISSFELLRMLRNSGEIDSKSGSSVLFSLVDAWNELSSSWSPGTSFLRCRNLCLSYFSDKVGSVRKMFPWSKLDCHSNQIILSPPLPSTTTQHHINFMYLLLRNKFTLGSSGKSSWQ